MPFLPQRYEKNLPDTGHEETDNLLDDLTAEIESVYGQAYGEMLQKTGVFMTKFYYEDSKKRQEAAKGLITKDDYKNWRIRRIFTGQWWYSMTATMADDLANSAGIAYSIINDYVPAAYAINYNWTAYFIEKNTQIDTVFTLFNEYAVERLLREKPDLLPKARIDIARDKEWSKQKMTSAVMQSILQGEDVHQLAERLSAVSDMSRNSAVTNARTMINSAENAGRRDQHDRAVRMGIKVRNLWSATLDYRTRDSHRVLDGYVVDVGKKFPNGLEYPGDTHGRPEEVYNCRCFLRSLLPEQDFGKFERFSRLGSMSYEDWKNAKGGEPEFKSVRNEKRDKNMYKEYKKLLGKQAPQNFSDFQKTKYHDPQEWNRLKKLARKQRNQNRKK